MSNSEGVLISNADSFSIKKIMLTCFAVFGILLKTYPSVEVSLTSKGMSVENGKK